MIFYFAFVVPCGALQTHFHQRGRTHKTRFSIAILGYGLSHEKVLRKSPQAFPEHKYKNQISAEQSQSARVGHFKL